MKNYIGLDAHSQNCLFAVMNEAGEVVDCQSMATDERKLVGFLKGIPGKKVLTFEESFLSKWLYAILKPHVEELIVCNPCYLPKKGKAKTDKIDAINLAQQLRAGNLVPVFHVNQDELFDLRKAVRSHQQIVKQAIQTKNRIRMPFRSQGISIKGPEPFKNREVFNRLTSSVDQMVGRHLFDQLQALQTSRQAYQLHFAKVARENKTVFLLTSIPGIEAIRACVIAAIVCDARRFPSKHHFWSYCSLVRHKQISDGITYGYKRAFGRSELKGVFYGAAATILMAHKNSALFSYHQGQMDRGRDRWAARLALTRKIASIALSVMRNEKPYEVQGALRSEKVRARSKALNAQI